MRGKFHNYHPARRLTNENEAARGPELLYYMRLNIFHPAGISQDGINEINQVNTQSQYTLQSEH